MRIRRIAVIAATVGTLVVGGAGAASAAGGGGAGWTPVPITGFTDANECSFAVIGEIVVAKVVVRTTISNPDGSPAQQEFRGPLVIRYRNADTGTSVVRSVSGRALVDYQPDGTQVWHVRGGIGVGVPLGNPDFPSGEYVFHGDLELILHTNGDVAIPVLDARSEDLCDTLG